MALAPARRIRALWLVVLLALAPASPLALSFSGHGSDDTHGTALVHDATDHGIAPGPIPDTPPERHCLYCHFASSVRLGGLGTQATLAAPSSAPIDWPDTLDATLRTRLRHALPARAPPRHA